MRDIFNLESRTQILSDESYIMSYPHLLSYFASKEIFDASDFVRGAHMVYGWMPTILELHPGPPGLDFNGGAKLLTRAKHNEALSDNDIDSLSCLINHSLVGASKLLHFVAPSKFAIWDTKVYAFVFEEKPYNYRVNQIANYRHYLNKLAQLQSDPRFGAFLRAVNKKIGYDVSPLRSLELVMYLNPDSEVEP